MQQEHEHERKLSRVAHVEDNTFEPRELAWRQKLGLVKVKNKPNTKKNNAIWQDLVAVLAVISLLLTLLILLLHAL